MGLPIVRMRFMLRSYFSVFSNKFRAGMADNEDTLTCTTRRKLMSLPDITSYREEYSRNERLRSLLPCKSNPGGKILQRAKSNFPGDFWKNLSYYYSNFEHAAKKWRHFLLLVGDVQQSFFLIILSYLLVKPQQKVTWHLVVNSLWAWRLERRTCHKTQSPFLHCLVSVRCRK